jgi:hypothetical protein
VLKKKNFLAILLLLFIGVLAYKSGKTVLLFIQDIFAPRAVSIVCNDIYSESLQHEIKKFLCSNFESRAYSEIDLPIIYKMLKYKFKVVKKMLWTWKSFDEAVLVVEGVRPVFFVNNKFVLGNKKRLLDFSMFSDLDMDLLKPITLGEKLYSEKVDSEVYKVINTVPESYWGAYNVSYLEKHDIVLEPKDKKCIKYVLDESVVFDQDKLKKASLLAQEIKKRLTVCDLRFRDRICIRSEKI